MWLFTIIIQPLIHFLEFFYSLFYKITSDNCGLSILGLSFVVALFTLPLYMVAEKWQETERRTEEKLKPGIDRIKKTFKGDEQYMILTTFYRQNHYHPLMSLRSSFSLLIQIPFFIAAYTFLSNLEILQGASFLFIDNLGSPDATFHIGNFSINLLPIAMTIINCLAGTIYSKGHPKREKIQIYGMAGIFLVILYNSPAGLVVYWTMNNILSLIKNIFYKIKKPRQVLYIIACTVATFLIILPFSPFKTNSKIINYGLMGIGVAIPFTPFAIHFISNIIAKNFHFLDENKKLRSNIFFLSAINMALLAGLCIPSMIIASEPLNYCYVENFKSPFTFIRQTMFIASGLFILWPVCFYELFSAKIKKVFTIIFSLFSFCALINTFAFSGEYGSLLPECLFMFDITISVSPIQILIHLFIISSICILIIFLLIKFPKIVSSFSCIAIFSLAILSIKNITVINKEYKIMTPPVVENEIKPVYHLSKTGKNVIVIMQDRLFSPFVNEVLKDFPEINTPLDGFTYYPNTVSNGWLTMLGAPGLFGGYDFTPYEINKRIDETLQQKHNKALLTMPVLFNQAGFNTTVANLPYENFLEYPIDNMYKGYEFIHRADTRGIYTDLWYRQHTITKTNTIAKTIKRNMIWFSIFKMCPPILRNFIYYNEYWNSDIDSYSRELARFLDNYVELDYLPELTDFTSENDSFIMIDNEMTHEPIMLQYPDYEPFQEVTSFGPFKYSHSHYYGTTVAAMKKLGEFFSYLKENDVYDNTRIIVVSDHGAKVSIDNFTNNSTNQSIEKSNFVASLLVKDFNEHGALKKDMTFMLNTDTPYLATKDIIENARNPFTGTPLKVENKNDFAILADGEPEGTRSRHKTKFSINDNQWVYVKDDIYKNENWGKFTPNAKNERKNGK